MTEHGTSPTSHGTSGETQEPRYREIAAAVERHGGKRSAAARELGISPSTVTVAVLRAERDRFRVALADIAAGTFDSWDRLAEAMWDALADNGVLRIHADSPRELLDVAASVLARLSPPPVAAVAEDPACGLCGQPPDGYDHGLHGTHGWRPAAAGDRDRREARLIEDITRGLVISGASIRLPEDFGYAPTAADALERLAEIGAAPGQAGPPESRDG